MNARTFLKTLAVLTVTLAFGSGSARAAVIYGIQPGTGQILTLDPTTGAVLNSFATPEAIAAGDLFAGLSYAAPLNELLYFNQNVSNTLFRLNPDTGAVIATAAGDQFANSGLSYQQIGGTNFLYYAHQNVDIHARPTSAAPMPFSLGRPHRREA